MPRIPVVLGLTAVWLLLWGSVTPTLVIGGLLTSVLVLLLFPFPAGPVALDPAPVADAGPRRPLRGGPAARQHRGGLARRPAAAPPPSAVVRVELLTRSDLLVTATAELVSLVPGSILVEVDQDGPAIYLHVLDARTPEHLERAVQRVHVQERRVVEAWAPRDERDLYRRLDEKRTVSA